MMNRRMLMILMAIAMSLLLLTLVGCGTPATPEQPEEPAAPTEAEEEEEEETEEEEAPGSLVIALGREFTILDPHKSSSAGDISGLFAIFDRLVSVDGNGELAPLLATEWSVSADGLVTTFQLRDDVVFHDGTPFDAEAVKFNFDRIMDPETESQAARFNMGPYVETRVIDDYTVEVVHETPYGPFLRQLPHYGMGMVSPTAVEELGFDIGQKPVGTGPYKFEEWVGGSHVDLSKNEDYAWGPDFLQPQGYYDEIRFRFIEENSTRAAALERNEVDVAAGLAANDWIRLRDSGNFDVHVFNRIGMPPPGLFINVAREPTDDVRVRRALIHGVDSQIVRDVVYEGVPVPSGGVLSSHAWAYNPEAGEMYDYDPAKAAELLEEAGWKMATDFRAKDDVPLKINYLTLPGARPVAEVIEPMLRDLGFAEVEIWALDNPMQQNTAQEGEHNLVWTQWGGTDPSALIGRYGSENIGTGWNFCHYSNPAVDELFLRGESETDLAEREAIYKEIQWILMEDATILPLNQFTLLWAFRPGIKGLEPHEPTGFMGYVANLHE